MYEISIRSLSGSKTEKPWPKRSCTKGVGSWGCGSSRASLVPIRRQVPSERARDVVLTAAVRGRQGGHDMARYEHPYRLDAAVVDALLAHLNRLINASNGETRCEQGEMLVPLLTAHHLSTLINVLFWASFKKEEGR